MCSTLYSLLSTLAKLPIMFSCMLVLSFVFFSLEFILWFSLQLFLSYYCFNIIRIMCIEHLTQKPWPYLNILLYSRPSHLLDAFTLKSLQDTILCRFYLPSILVNDLQFHESVIFLEATSITSTFLSVSQSFS